MKNHVIAVIGCGRVSVMHFASIAENPLAQLICCCDNKFERAEAFARKYGAKAYADYEEMLERHKKADEKDKNCEGQMCLDDISETEE